MSDDTPFSKLMPGFEFMQSLAKGSGSALPNIGQWVAPTLDPAEIDKRVEELRTVQFWLEQNARMLGATIQALEVQRMTLSTLKTMNVQMNDLRDSLTIRKPATTEAPPEKEAASKPKAKAAKPAVDPMQWWGALTKQFTELATHAMKEGVSPPSPASPPAASRKAATVAKPAKKTLRRKARKRLANSDD